ncbi:MAG: hypothetical protein MO846_11975 [Candidatus Devosia symbiotica]|nr:hypothetical protein [Candidatus Devosia symbiotica]
MLINQCLLGWFYDWVPAATGVLLQILLHSSNIVATIVLVFGLHTGVRGAALGTVLGAAAMLSLILLVRHYGGLRRLLGMVPRIELLDTTALQRMFGLSRDLMIRFMALIGAYAWFAVQGAHGGDCALCQCYSAQSANSDWLFPRKYRPGGRAVDRQGGGGQLASGLRSRLWAELSVGPECRCAPLCPGLSAGGRTLCSDFQPAFIYDGILIGTTLNTTMRNGIVVSLVVFLTVTLLLQPVWGN